ncbi:DUF4870 domain-containing protein [Olleya aquimaris]|uniref:DUF4870 domain-containing protein n=1 Tax=Olleya sediminilitoris TaxID=2795739 RepID=A0ABS1WPF7_9FLAO|nr:DUF4870 domain-containing protein [Olleya sediminilitoris]AXO79914.1 DUF4870 domain-containing protein [Olleya aquimaris]MBL7561015.1 DUF4870 domain-containing protein [Olleya sediminilitoris]
MVTNHHKNIATFIHLSTFARFIFPFGNIIAPLVLWITNKEKSDFVDTHGKQAINFQFSILLYVLIIGTLCIPFFAFSLFNHLDILDFNYFSDISIKINSPSPLFYICGTFSLLAILGFILEIVFIINASLKAKDGEDYNYPFTINFIK